MFLDKKRTDEFHHSTEEVSTYCRVIYVFLVRAKVSDEEMVPKYAASLSHDNLGTLFTLPNYLKFFESEKYVKTGEEVVYQL